MNRLEIDGNDGTGKSTLVENLASYGIQATDRGRMTKATDNPELEPEEGVTYILLELEPKICQGRLQKAGKDITEKYHTLKDLQHYDRRFQEVAKTFRAHRIQSQWPRTNLQQALAVVRGSPLKLGVPKGSLGESVDKRLRYLGFPTGGSKDRNYVSEGMGVQSFTLKPKCLPQMVAMGMLDMAFTGRDILINSGYENLVEVLDLKTNPVKVVAASHREDILETAPHRPIIVATVLPRIASDWLFNLGLAHIILETHGGTEAFVPHFADLLVDVVETGETLKANGLIPIHTILESSTILFTREEIRDRPDVKAFIDTLRNRER